MEEEGSRKKELKMLDEEWFSVWMLEVVMERKTMETFIYQNIRN